LSIVSLSKHHFPLHFILWYNSESYDVSFPNVNDSCWYAHISEGHSVSFIMPLDHEMKGMVLCVVYLSNPKIIESEFTIVLIVKYTKCTCHDILNSFNDEDWRGIISNLGSGDKVEIFVRFQNSIEVLIGFRNIVKVLTRILNLVHFLAKFRNLF